MWAKTETVPGFGWNINKSFPAHPKLIKPSEGGNNENRFYWCWKNGCRDGAEFA